MQIKIIRQTEKQTDLAKLKIYQIRPPIPPKFQSIQFGFDAGTTHIGIARVDPCNDLADLFEISIQHSSDPMERIKAIQQILTQCQFIFPAAFKVYIEGSAYSKSFRQTELAEIRTSTALWFDLHGGKVKFVNPLTIRKTIFGNGRTKAHDVWEGIEPNALAALSCALLTL